MSGEDEDEFGDFAQARTVVPRKTEPHERVPPIPPPSSATSLKISLPSQNKTTTSKSRYTGELFFVSFFSFVLEQRNNTFSGQAFFRK